MLRSASHYVHESTKKHGSKHSLSWKLPALNSGSKLRISHWTYELLPHLAFLCSSGVIFLLQCFSPLIASADLQIPCDFSPCIHQAGSEAPELMFLRSPPFQTSGQKVHIEKVLLCLIQQAIFFPSFSIQLSIFKKKISQINWTELGSGLYRTGSQCHFVIVVFQSSFQPWKLLITASRLKKLILNFTFYFLLHV